MAKARTDTLEAALQNLFTGGDTTRVSWFALTGGEQLFAEGDPADTLYLVRSGRLGVFCHDGDQAPRFLGVVRPGEPVGEMSMLAGTPHTASVVALRDSEILALPRETFFEAARSQPDLMVELSRLMIRRSRDQTLGGGEPSVFGFISARPKPIRAFVERIAASIQAQGFTCQIIDHSALSSVADWFSRVEDSHDFVLYVAEADEPAWAQLCTRQVDRLFIVGNPLTTPPGANLPRNPALDAQQRTDLILLRDARMPRPANTSVWLDAVRPGRWFHATDGNAEDAARMARIVTGTAVGVVLSGGGARAYAHIGALRALREANVPLDFLGGASMGAVMAAGPALGWTQEELEDEIKRAFVASDPLSDITFPLIAMTRKRPRDTVTQVRSQLGRFGFGQERAETKIGDLSGVIESDDIDAIHLDLIEYAREFEHGVRPIHNLADIAELALAQRGCCSGQVGDDKRAAFLRCVHDGGVKHRPLRHEPRQSFRIWRGGKGVPFGKSPGGRVHPRCLAKNSLVRLSASCAHSSFRRLPNCVAKPWSMPS